MARRAGLWARQKVRAKHRQFLARSWPRLIVAAGVFSGLAVVFILYLPRTAGLVSVGAALTCIPWLVSLVAVQTTGSGPISMGAEAEEWSSNELSRLCRRRYSVAGARRRHLVDHVPLPGWDIDHVLIGPEGVAVVETKWATDRWVQTDQARVAAAARSARADARKLEAILRAEPYQLHLKVTPVVALWPAERSRPAPVDPGGTAVVWGRELRPWWRERNAGSLTEAAVQAAHTAVVDFVKMRDSYELRGAGAWRRLRHRLRLNPART